MNPHDLLVSFDENSMAFRTPLQRSFADAISVRSTSSLPSAIEYDEEDDDYNEDDIHSAISAERAHHAVTSQNVIINSVNTKDDTSITNNVNNDNDAHSNNELENVNRNNNNNNHYHFKQESRDVFEDSQLGTNVDNDNCCESKKAIHKDCMIELDKELPQSQQQQPIQELESPPQWSVAKIQTDPAMALSALQHERAQRIIAEQQVKLLLPLHTSPYSSESPNKHHSSEVDDTTNTTNGNNAAVMLDAATLQVLSKQIVQCHLEINNIVSELISNYKTNYKPNPSTSASSSSSGCSNTSTPFTSALTSNTLLRWLLDEMIRRLSSTTYSSNQRVGGENDVVSVDDSNVSQDSHHKWDRLPVLVTSRNKYKQKSNDNINKNNNDYNDAYGNSSTNNSNDCSKDNNNNNGSKGPNQMDEEEHSSYTDTVVHQTDYDGRQRR